MAYFQNNFLKYRREQWKRSIVRVEVQVGSSWISGDINKKEIEGDTLVIMATFPSIDNSAATISASRLIDARGEVAAYQTRAIQKVAGQGVMIKITVPIYEVTA